MRLPSLAVEAREKLQKASWRFTKVLRSCAMNQRHDGGLPDDVAFFGFFWLGVGGTTEQFLNQSGQCTK